MHHFLLFVMAVPFLFDSIASLNFDPSSQPSRYPSVKPSRIPLGQPTRQPSSHPSSQPRTNPSMQPTAQPRVQPSSQPSANPSNQPTIQPRCRPSAQPTKAPILKPSGQPSRHPSRQPSGQPSGQPSRPPSKQPSCNPTCQPSPHPSVQPLLLPSLQPTHEPSSQPSAQPQLRPSRQPSRQPFVQHPSNAPSLQPSSSPSAQPFRSPTCLPKSRPTHCPSRQPSRQPVRQPSQRPLAPPTSLPTSLSKPTRLGPPIDLARLSKVARDSLTTAYAPYPLWSSFGGPVMSLELCSPTGDWTFVDAYAGSNGTFQDKTGAPISFSSFCPYPKVRLLYDQSGRGLDAYQTDPNQMPFWHPKEKSFRFPRGAFLHLPVAARSAGDPYTVSLRHADIVAVPLSPVGASSVHQSSFSAEINIGTRTTALGIVPLRPSIAGLFSFTSKTGSHGLEVRSTTTRIAYNEFYSSTATAPDFFFSSYTPGLALTLSANASTRKASTYFPFKSYSNVSFQRISPTQRRGVYTHAYLGQSSSYQSRNYSCNCGIFYFVVFSSSLDAADVLVMEGYAAPSAEKSSQENKPVDVQLAVLLSVFCSVGLCLLGLIFYHRQMIMRLKADDQEESDGEEDASHTPLSPEANGREGEDEVTPYLSIEAKNKSSSGSTPSQPILIDFQMRWMRIQDHLSELDALDALEQQPLNEFTIDISEASASDDAEFALSFVPLQGESSKDKQDDIKVLADVGPAFTSSFSSTSSTSSKQRNETTPYRAASPTPPSILLTNIDKLCVLKGAAAEWNGVHYLFRIANEHQFTLVKLLRCDSNALITVLLRREYFSFPLPTDSTECDDSFPLVAYRKIRQLFGRVMCLLELNPMVVPLLASRPYQQISEVMSTHNPCLLPGTNIHSYTLLLPPTYSLLLVLTNVMDEVPILGRHREVFDSLQSYLPANRASSLRRTRKNSDVAVMAATHPSIAYFLQMGVLPASSETTDGAKEESDANVKVPVDEHAIDVLEDDPEGAEEEAEEWDEESDATGFISLVVDAILTVTSAFLRSVATSAVEKVVAGIKEKEAADPSLFVRRLVEKLLSTAILNMAATKNGEEATSPDQAVNAGQGAERGSNHDEGVGDRDNEEPKERGGLQEERGDGAESEEIRHAGRRYEEDTEESNEEHEEEQGRDYDREENQTGGMELEGNGEDEEYDEEEFDEEAEDQGDEDKQEEVQRPASEQVTTLLPLSVELHRLSTSNAFFPSNQDHEMGGLSEISVREDLEEEKEENEEQEEDGGEEYEDKERVQQEEKERGEEVEENYEEEEFDAVDNDLDDEPFPTAIEVRASPLEKIPSALVSPSQHHSPPSSSSSTMANIPSLEGGLPPRNSPGRKQSGALEPPPDSELLKSNFELSPAAFVSAKSLRKALRLRSRLLAKQEKPPSPLRRLGQSYPGPVKAINAFPHIMPIKLVKPFASLRDETDALTDALLSRESSLRLSQKQPAPIKNGVPLLGLLGSHKVHVSNTSVATDPSTQTQAEREDGKLSLRDGDFRAAPFDESKSKVVGVTPFLNLDLDSMHTSVIRRKGRKADVSSAAFVASSSGSSVNESERNRQRLLLNQRPPSPQSFFPKRVAGSSSDGGSVRAERRGEVQVYEGYQSMVKHLGFSDELSESAVLSHWQSTVETFLSQQTVEELYASLGRLAKTLTDQQKQIWGPSDDEKIVALALAKGEPILATRQCLGPEGAKLRATIQTMVGSLRVSELVALHCKKGGKDEEVKDASRQQTETAMRLDPVFSPHSISPDRSYSSRHSMRRTLRQSFELSEVLASIEPLGPPTPREKEDMSSKVQAFNWSLEESSSVEAKKKTRASRRLNNLVGCVLSEASSSLPLQILTERQQAKEESDRRAMQSDFVHVRERVKKRLMNQSPLL